MAEEINKSHQLAKDMFAQSCLDLIGIRPIEDDKLVLSAAVDFSAYIKTFKRLDQSVGWHKHFIETMVKIKVDALSKRITKEYGTHKEYLDRVRQRSGKSSSSYQRDSERVGTTRERVRLKAGISYGESKVSAPDSQ